MSHYGIDYGDWEYGHQRYVPTEECNKNGLVAGVTIMTILFIVAVVAALVIAFVPVVNVDVCSTLCPTATTAVTPTGGTTDVCGSGPFSLKLSQNATTSLWVFPVKVLQTGSSATTLPSDVSVIFDTGSEIPSVPLAATGTPTTTFSETFAGGNTIKLPIVPSTVTYVGNGCSLSTNVGMLGPNGLPGASASGTLPVGLWGMLPSQDPKVESLTQQLKRTFMHIDLVKSEALLSNVGPSQSTFAVPALVSSASVNWSHAYRVSLKSLVLFMANGSTVTVEPSRTPSTLIIDTGTNEGFVLKNIDGTRTTGLIPSSVADGGRRATGFSVGFDDASGVTRVVTTGRAGVSAFDVPANLFSGGPTTPAASDIDLIFGAPAIQATGPISLQFDWLVSQSQPFRAAHWSIASASTS